MASTPTLALPTAARSADLTMKIFPKILCLLSIIFASATQVIANDNVPPAGQATPLLFKGGAIHTISGDTIPSGQMLVVKGEIDIIAGKNGKINLPKDTRVIDFTGKHLYPGMISANSVLGLTEINAVRATLDLKEPGDINPNARAQVSINPDSELIPVTRANGVLAALTVPQTGGGLLSGQSALIRLDGWTWEEMTVKSPVGMHVFWPNLIKISRWTSQVDEKELEKLRKAYDKDIEKISRAFADARAYALARKDPKSGIKTDLRWESMIPIIEGKLRVFIHAQTAGQIRNALHFTATEELPSPVIVGGRDAWRLTAELKSQKASVILSEVNSLPLRRWEAYDTAFVAAGKLHRAGIPFCIANGGGTSAAANERNLPYQAGRAVAHGLLHDVALKAVTLFPAQILGVSGQLGSLDPGKEATFFISNGDPLEVSSRVERAFIRGREIDLSSKHTRLYEKYKEKYRQKKEE